MSDDLPPNQALQRTAPAVTAAASCLRLSPTTQGPRQPPRSLSLRSLGDARAFSDQSPIPRTKPL